MPPEGSLCAGLVLVGVYLEPSLEIAGVRSAPELQETSLHCWSLAPQRSRVRKLKGKLAEVMMKATAATEVWPVPNMAELNFHRILD